MNYGEKTISKCYLLSITTFEGFVKYFCENYRQKFVWMYLFALRILPVCSHHILCRNFLRPLFLPDFAENNLYESISRVILYK